MIIKNTEPFPGLKPMTGRVPDTSSRGTLLSQAIEVERDKEQRNRPQYSQKNPEQKDSPEEPSLTENSMAAEDPTVGTALNIVA
jgi:hypothetical protein